MMRVLAVFAACLVAGCQLVLDPGTGSSPTPTASAPPPAVASTRAMQSFRVVVANVEPVAERICRQELPRGNCDFRIVVDERPNLAPNAYQTLDNNGRPVIGFTVALIEDARNSDELAFILGHEAAHHIEGHIPQSQQQATAGAILGGILGSAIGFDAQGVETVSRIGATVGGRRFSKEFELEADELGTVIAARAGYNPVRGAEFFNRIPDPGDQFLGTHPPNGERIQTVRRTAARL